MYLWQLISQRPNQIKEFCDFHWSTSVCTSMKVAGKNRVIIMINLTSHVRCSSCKNTACALAHHLYLCFTSSFKWSIASTISKKQVIRKRQYCCVRNLVTKENVHQIWIEKIFRNTFSYPTVMKFWVDRSFLQLSVGMVFLKCTKIFDFQNNKLWSFNNFFALVKCKNHLLT